MKKCLFAFLILFFSGMTLLFAQDKTPSKAREFGLTFSNLDNFGILYKTGNDKTLLRLSLLALNLNTYHDYGRDIDSIDHKYTGMGAGFRIGFEKRILLVKNLNLILGSEIGISYSSNRQEDDNYKITQWNLSPGADFIFGVAYQPGEHFIISAEVTPGLAYLFGKSNVTRNHVTNEVTTNNLIFGLSNNNAAITIAYRFSK